MKYLVLVAMLIAAFAQQPTKAPEGKRASKPDSAQVTNQGDTGEAQQKPAPSATSTPQPANPSVKAHDEDLKIQRKLVWFTGALVAVGFLQAGVMALQWLMYRRQANEMRRQRHEMKRQRRYMRLQWKAMGEQVTEIERQTGILKDSVTAAKDNAEAAKASAEALINSERAWVMADIRWTADMPPRSVPRPTNLRIIDGSGDVTIDVCLICKNEGRTPAWITQKVILFRVVDSLPKPPPVGGIYEFREGDYFFFGPEPIGIETESTITTTLTCKGQRELGKALLVYGIVKYRDIFSPDRETRFGYMITNTHLHRIASVRLSIPSLGVDEDDIWHYNSYT